MNILTADTSLQHSLDHLNGLTEIRDAAGGLIGYFSPATKAASAVYAQAAAEFDLDELQRRKQSREKGLTTQQVLAHLKSLET